MKLISLQRHDLDAVLTLNNRHAAELSWLDRERLNRIVKAAYYARAVFDRSAFLIAFDQDADYDSHNFQWFRERLPRFIYVDRIVVDSSARGRGLALKLYQDLFDRARRDAYDTVCCEVNRDPPNPASDRFHEKLGFTSAGKATIASGKTVRYLWRTLARGAATETVHPAFTLSVCSHER